MVSAVVVKFPFCRRPWALPILEALYRPEELNKTEGRRHKTPARYGATERTVKIASACGHWSRAGQGLVPGEWLFVRDVTGTRDEQYFHCTSPGLLRPEQIVKALERQDDFRRGPSHLGIEGPRHWCLRSVLRLAPCLFGLFSFVTLIYHGHVERYPVRVMQRLGYEKSEPTFADPLAAVRGLFLAEAAVRQPPFRRVWEKSPR